MASAKFLELTYSWRLVLDIQSSPESIVQQLNSILKKKLKIFIFLFFQSYIFLYCFYMYRYLSSSNSMTQNLKQQFNKFKNRQYFKE